MQPNKNNYSNATQPPQPEFTPEMLKAAIGNLTLEELALRAAVIMEKAKVATVTTVANPDGTYTHTFAFTTDSNSKDRPEGE